MSCHSSGIVVFAKDFDSSRNRAVFTSKGCGLCPQNSDTFKRADHTAIFPRSKQQNWLPCWFISTGQIKPGKIVGIIFSHRWFFPLWILVLWTLVSLKQFNMVWHPFTVSQSHLAKGGQGDFSPWLAGENSKLTYSLSQTGCKKGLAEAGPIYSIYQGHKMGWPAICKPLNFITQRHTNKQNLSFHCDIYTMGVGECVHFSKDLAWKRFLKWCIHEMGIIFLLMNWCEPECGHLWGSSGPSWVTSAPGAIWDKNELCTNERMDGSHYCNTCLTPIFNSAGYRIWRRPFKCLQPPPAVSRSEFPLAVKH